MSDDLSLPRSEREMYKNDSLICKLTKERVALEEIVESHRDEMARLVQRVVKLTQERDEARREILESLHPDLRESYAAAREWDYLKENTND